MAYSLIQLEYFYWVCVHQSFVGAAKSLKVSKAHVSQSIGKLECELGGLLFHRTTRVVRLTQLAERIFPIVEEIVRLKETLGNEIEEMSASPTGLIRMTCPNAFAECYLASNLPGFLKEYPQIKLEMNLSSQLIDLERHKIDIAIRLTHEPPLDKVATKLGEYQIGYYATPEYLQTNGIPNSVSELNSYDLLVSTTVLKGTNWVFMVEGNRKTIEVNPYLKADNHHIIKAAMMNSLGISCLPSFLVNDEMKKGILVPVLNDNWLPAIPVYVVYSKNKVMPAKLSVFIAFIKELITIC